MFVLDASVAVKWFVAEEGQEAAEQLLMNCPHFFAPSLILVEVTAALGRKYRLGFLDAAEFRACAAEALAALRMPNISLFPDETLLADAMGWCEKIKHPIQDCLYLALAAREKLPIITADQTFYDRAKEAYPKMNLLGR